MASPSEYLLDIEALDAEGGAVTVRLATCPYMTRHSDSPPSAVYLAAIADPGDFDSNLFDEARTFGSTRTGTGSIVVVNTDTEFDDWMDLVLDGRPFTLRRIDDAGLPFSAAEIVQTGVIESLDSTSATEKFELVIHDRLKVLDRPLLTERYAGTTIDGSSTVLTEGNADLKGQIKQRIFGSVSNVEPQPVNVAVRIFKFSVGAVTSIVPFEGRAPLVPAGNFASAGTLKTNLTTGTAIKSGQYGTVLGSSLIGLRVNTSKPLTADVVEGTSSKPGAVCKRILQAYGLVPGVDYDVDSFDALDEAAPYDLGILVNDDTTCGEVLNRVRQSVGAWLTTDALGVLSAGRFMGPGGSPVRGFIDADVLGAIEILGNPDFDAVPVWRTTVNWGPIGLVQDDSQLDNCVDQATRAFVGTATRSVTSEDDAVHALHPMAAELTIDTLLKFAADAQAVADHLQGLYGVPRRAVRLPVRRIDAEGLRKGDTVRLELSRLLTGNDMVVLGRRELRSREQVGLIVWG